MQAFAERGGPFRHPFTLRLSVAARDALNRYFQSTGLSPSAAVRAVFRAALDEGAFATVTAAKAIYSDDGQFVETRIRRARSRPEPRDPQKIAARLPNLKRETALRQKVALPNRTHFVGTIGGVGYVSSYLDDAAKEGLLHAMSRTGLNHADAARMLLARAEPPAKQP